MLFLLHRDGYHNRDMLYLTLVKVAKFYNCSALLKYLVTNNTALDLIIPVKTSY